MKGHKLLALLMALLLCIQLLPVSTAFAEEVSEDGVSVTLKANSADYGDVTSSSTLTGLKKDDTVELTATPKENGHETFSQWVVYKNSSCTTKAAETDYTLTETETGKATLTVKGTTDLWVMAVFQGKIVGLQDKSNYAPLPATRGNSKNLRSLFSITKDATVSGIIASATITGWDNDPTVPLVATITLPSNPAEVATGAWRLQVWETAAGFGNSASADAVHYNMMLAPGARFDFSDLTKDSKRSSTYNQTSYSFGEGWDWTEYSFNIVDSEGTVLKPGKIVFKYPGIATIDAKNGSVKCGENTYSDGQTVNLGTGEKTITAVPAEGYFFTGWEIDGVELSDATANPLTFTMPSASTTIKANFAKTVSVTLKANSADYGDVTSSSTLTGLKKDDTVELTATPKENGHETFSQWVVYKNSSCTTKAAETDYTLTETETGKATLTVKGTTDLWVMAVFQGKIVGLQDKSNYAPLPATRGNSKNLRSLFSITKDATVSGIIASATITGWDNDPTVPLVATITLPSNPAEVATGAWRLQVWETAAGFGNSASADAVHYNMMLAPGARFDFSDLTKDSKRSSTYNQTSYSFGEGWDWTEYSFNIVDSEGTVLKPGKIVFKYPGIATIDAKNGSVKCGENTYSDGQTVNLGTGEKTITAVPAEGYFFTGWEIDGVELSDATANPLTFTMPSASTTIKANFATKAGTPELGYQLSIEGSGKVFVDGVERANGYMTEVADNTNVIFLAEPEEGYVLDHWEITSPIKDTNIPDSSGNLKQLYITTAYGGQFYNVKAVFAEKTTYKLRFKLMLGETDVTQSNAFKAACGRQNANTPYSAYTFPSAMTLDEIYSSLSAKNTISDFISFNAGLNYLDFPVDSEDWIVIQLDQYPGYTEQLGPKFIADGFVSSNEAAVEDSRSISNSRFGGRTYIVFKMTQDTTITANIHEAKYTAVTVPTDEKGTVTITPAADVEALGVWWEGSKLTVQAVPAEGYRFVRWQESAGGYINDENAAKNPLNITLGANDANFAPVFEAAESVDRSITKVVDPEGKATITINGSSDTIQVREGTVVSLGIDVDEYYLFDHWNVTQNGVESPDNLVISENQTSKSATFVMPFGESGVTVQAVLKDRYTGLSTLVYLMTGNNGSTAAAKGLTTVSLSKNGTPLTDVNCQVQKGDELEIAVTMLNENYVLREIVVYDMVSNKAIQTITDAQGTITIPRWSSWQIAVRIEEKTADTERHSISLTQPTTGGTISSSNMTSQPDKTITLTAVPDSGYVLKKWIVKDAQENAISVTIDRNDSNVGTFTMPKSDVTVTAEFVALAEVKPEITSVALLQGESGSEIVTGVLSGNKWTITIPDTVPAETVAKIPEGLSGLYLKIVTPAGVTVKQGQFEGDWSNGDVMCYMPVNEEVTFQAIAGTVTKDYTIKLVYSGSPLLSNGSATRISNSSASVQFSSNVAGNYFYKVVASGADAPTEEDVLASSNKGTAISGVNTITLSNLGDGARNIYIVVVSADGDKSAALKIEIPSYASDTGNYKVSVNLPKNGGTITTNRTRANAGDEIIVTVTPDSGYQMVEGSLTYTLGEVGGETVKITNNRFTMPAGNVSITCQWETATTTAKGITAFSINGVAGAVNNTTNTITITMPRGTDVTKLAPVIATNGVKSLTPGSGETVDFTNSVTYTATMEDGNTKTYIVTVYVNKGTLSDQFWDKMTDFTNQVPWWEYAKNQQSTSSYPKYW